ncbi:putative transport protein HsrA [uncultured delta proteobacterium]|uniref:Putative transport protein HsrA n=1 Tax=uncultured delta proteobacterium TaxID=34034 RepID=A0A212J6C0_9DELT|nr:putative transport protein HsrA [uncultured delta proteobacterium]
MALSTIPQPAVTVAADSTEPPPPAVSPMLRWIVAVAFFMQMLDGTILNTALPGIARDLMVSPLRMQSAVIAYMLTTALFIPASGWIADRFGTKRVFILAIFLFSLGSLLCALSQTLEFLVISRVVQGLGGALMVPVGRLAVLRAYPRRELVRVLSFITIPGLVGPLVGPMAGGFLVEYASWHWIFLINIPVGVLGIILAAFCMPDIAPGTGWKFDTSGFLLFGASMVLVTFSMEGLGELHLPKVQVTLLCALGLMFLGIYWLRALRTEHPLFDPRIFRTRSFAVGICGNLFARLGSGGVPFLMPLFLQLGLGFSPFFAGATMIPTALAGIAGKSLITRLVERIGFRKFLTANTAIVGLLIASFAWVDAATPYPVLLLHLAVFGTFNSMQFTAMNSVTLVDLENEHAGSGNSLLSVTMQVSVTCGVAMAAALLNGFSGAETLATDSPIPITIFTRTFLCVGVFTSVTALIFAQVPRDAGREARSEYKKDA